MLFRVVVASLAFAAAASAMQVQELNLYSPITGKKFVALGTAVSTMNVEKEIPADMGSDDDGCRHSAGPSEYERYVVTDPTSFFSALSVEWDDKSGRFVQPLEPEFRQWVEKRYNGELMTEIARAFAYQQKLRQAQNMPPLDRDSFVMAQEAIPVERRYAYALECYQRRGARSAVLAKLALTGAWALRARFQLPLADPRLAGGAEEVNDKVVRQVKDGETFSFEKWYGIYKGIFENGSKLTPSAYFVAGQTYFGFAVRRGDRKEATAILDAMMERFKANRENNDGFDFQRGLVRSMRRQFFDPPKAAAPVLDAIPGSYIDFTAIAAAQFRKAIAEEEFTRSRLPEICLAIAESLRRVGDLAGAYDWYLCVAQMAETQPKLRADIRVEGKAPGPSAPYHVQLGWLADRWLADLVRQGVPAAEAANGPDKGLINAILFEGLGTLDFVNPNWKPATGAETRDSAFVLDLIGKGVLVYQNKLGEWPEQLGDLWMRDGTFDRNRVNRFHCPVTGQPYVYLKPTGEAGPRTVLVATSEPLVTKDGKRYAGYLANNTVIWSETPLIAAPAK